MATTTPPAIDEAAATPGGVFAQAEAEAATARGTGDMLKARMPSMVKGAGYSQPGGNTPLTDQADIATRVHTATMALRTETWRGQHQKSDVVNKGFNGGFLNQFGRLKAALSNPASVSSSPSSSAACQAAPTHSSRSRRGTWASPESPPASSPSTCSHHRGSSTRSTPSTRRPCGAIPQVNNRTARGTPPNLGESRSATMPVAA